MDNYVITIARGFGSGGKAIGLLLSEMLNIPCYDKEILQMAADTSGINESYFFNSDEKVKTSFFSLLDAKESNGKYKEYLFTPENKKFTSNENLFNFQASVIKHIGTTESCIIIGRASDYILRNRSNVFRVNIQAPLDKCIQVTMKRMQLNYNEAMQMVRKSNKYRSDFYYYYTGESWDNPLNYDLCLNTSRLKRKVCAEIIMQSTEKMFGCSLTK